MLYSCGKSWTVQKAEAHRQPRGKRASCTGNQLLLSYLRKNQTLRKELFSLFNKSIQNLLIIHSTKNMLY